MKTSSLIFAIVLLVAVLNACRHNGPGPQSRASGPAAAVETRTYHARGIVKSIDPKRPSIEIDHEDIPGLMPAMTMEFHVRDGALLNGLKPGDRIEFTVENGVGGLKITETERR